MNSKKLNIRDCLLLLAPVAIGVICIYLWYSELHHNIGWKGEDWLHKPINSVYLITFLVVIAFLLPIVAELKMPIPWFLFYLLLLYAVSLGAYFVSKEIFYFLYRDGLYANDNYVKAMAIWKLLATVLVFATVYFMPMRHFCKTSDGMHVLTILVAIISVIPASIITIETFPLWNTRINFMNAVKIGYPLFWLPIFLGTLSTAAAKEWV